MKRKTRCGFQEVSVGFMVKSPLFTSLFMHKKSLNDLSNLPTLQLFWELGISIIQGKISLHLITFEFVV